MKKEKGAITDTFMFLILAFAFVTILILFFYIGSILTPRLENAVSNISGIENAEQILDDTYGKFSLSLDSLPWIALAIFLCLGLSTIIGGFMVNTHPVYFIVHIFIMILGVIIAVPLAETYNVLYENPDLVTATSQFQAVSWLMVRLPIVVSIVSGLTVIVLLVKLFKPQEYTY